MSMIKQYSKNRLLKRFAELGPYVREKQSTDERFFFDCLAVCVNARPAPEKREFFGWWMELEAKTDHFIYSYFFGLNDERGNWNETTIKSKQNQKKLDETRQNFHERLKKMMEKMDLKLLPSARLGSGQ